MPTPQPFCRQPAPTYLTVLATLVIVLTIAAMIHDRHKTRTGELRIQADVAKFRVAVRKDGRTVIPATDQRSFVLPPGDYQVILDPPDRGLQADPERLRVAPGKRSVTRIQFKPPTP
jgi:hypothetical protein